MSVEKLPGGGWRARWRDAQGNERSKGMRIWRKRDAEAYERKMLAERDRGAVATAGNMTIEELFDLWITNARHLASSSREMYKGDYRRYIGPELSHLKVVKVTSIDIDNFLVALNERGLAVTTQRRQLQSILSPMFTYARKRGLVVASPTVDVKPPRLETVEKRFLSMAELRQLAMAFPPRWQALIIFTGVMGPRYEEVWKIRPQDIEGRTVLIRGTKSKSSLRRVTMPRFVMDLVAYQLMYYSDDQCLWPTKNGGPPQNTHTWRSTTWRRYLPRAGVGHLRFHDLRHTAAALAVRSGANPLLVQRRLGHSSISVTLGTYGHLFPEADGEVADGLDEMW